MKTISLKARSIGRIGFLVLFLWPMIPPLLAGIPEPGIVLYGVVADDLTGTRITSGTLQIIYTDQTTTKAVTNLIARQDLAGVYSYVSEIQFESAVTNQPVTRIDALELPLAGAPARTFNVSATSTAAPVAT